MTMIIKELIFLIIIVVLYYAYDFIKYFRLVSYLNIDSLDLWKYYLNGNKNDYESLFYGKLVEKFYLLKYDGIGLAVKSKKHPTLIKADHLDEFIAHLSAKSKETYYKKGEISLSYFSFNVHFDRGASSLEEMGLIREWRNFSKKCHEYNFFSDYCLRSI
jgi:hypothetical protein